MCILRLCQRKNNPSIPEKPDKQSVLIPPLKKKFPVTLRLLQKKRNNESVYTFNPKKMKKIFTLCSLVTLSFFANNSYSQINENFNNGFAPLQADCWQFTSMMHATIPSGYVINGNGSAYSEPPVSNRQFTYYAYTFTRYRN
jgi:hypothetical protein